LLLEILAYVASLSEAKKAFNGSTEERRTPKALNGEEVYQQVNHLRASYDKRTKITVEKNIWKMRSIFFDLPY